MMNTVKLKGISIKNFKCYENVSIKFNDKLTQIKGITGIGKTTIKDAYLWALGFDCDFAPKIDDYRVKNIDTIVELELRVNDTDYLLARISKQKWKLNGETEQEEFVGNDNKFEIDNKPITATNYKAKIVELFDINDVRLVADLKAFNTDNGTKWTWKERRAFLFQLFNIEDKIQTLANDKKFEPIKDYLDKGYDEIDIGIKLNADKKMIHDKLYTNKMIVLDRTKELQEYQNIDFTFYENEKARLEQDLEDLQKQELQEVIDYEKQIKQLKLNINTGKARLLDLKSLKNHFNTQIRKTEIEKFDTEFCPRCNQRLTDESLQELKNKFESDRTKRLNELTECQKSTLLGVQNLQERLIYQENELNRLEGLKNAPTNANQSKVDIQNEIKATKEQIEALNQQIYKKPLIANLQSKIDELKRENRTLLNQETERVKKQNTLKKYTEAKIALIYEEVNKHFNGISFRFFKFNSAKAENEYQPTCECMLNGIVYSNLSQGQKIIADFETNKGLQKILELNVPQFIDNKQDNTFKMESDYQIIELITCEETNINARFIRDVYTIDDCERKGD